MLTNQIYEIQIGFQQIFCQDNHRPVRYNFLPSQYLYEPCHEETRVMLMRKQRHRSAVTAQLISAFVSATRIVQLLFFLNPKLQASSYFP